MKPETPPQILRSAMAELAAVGTELQTSQYSLETSTAERAERLKTADLNDPKALDEISRLHVKIDLLPLRVAALGEKQTGVERKVLEASNDCISKELSPRAGNARRAVEAKVRAQLKPHFAEVSLLERAVADSQLVRAASVVGVGCSVTQNPIQGVVGFAEKILKELDALEKLEATLR